MKYKRISCIDLGLLPKILLLCICKYSKICSETLLVSSILDKKYSIYSSKYLHWNKDSTEGKKLAQEFLNTSSRGCKLMHLQVPVRHLNAYGPVQGPWAAAAAAVWTALDHHCPMEIRPRIARSLSVFKKSWSRDFHLKWDFFKNCNKQFTNVKTICNASTPHM